MPAPRISLNVIVYNEEARLEQCLLDARPHVDEIVVVDQMSTDRTPEIAQRLADVFIRDVHHGHAEPSRELAASRSSGDWILVLDADETMSDLLKAEIRGLVEGEADGYWIRKTNVVDGVETSTVLHLRLVRASRARFDPRPHGGAMVVSNNVETFDRIGIIHPKTEAEQLYDDQRYEQIAAEERAPSSSKRNWLQHNRTLRAHRARARRTDLEALLPADAVRVLVVGGVAVEVTDREVVRVDDLDDLAAASPFDAAIVSLGTADRAGVLGRLGSHLRPGGTVVGTVPAVRNLRRIEDTVTQLITDDPATAPAPAAGTTRRALFGELDAAGLDPRWARLVGDGWLDPIPLRADGSGAIVESTDFFLRDVPADVAEEFTAAEILFAAVVRAAGDDDVARPVCSVVVVPLADGDADLVVDALRADASQVDHEIVIVAPERVPTPDGVVRVTVADDASMSARWNAGTRAATGELVAFLSGTTTPEPGWLDRLVDASRARPDIGAVGSKLVAPDETVEHVGLVVGRDGIPYRVHQGEPADLPRANRTRIVPAVAADGMITERLRFLEIGGFDESFVDDLAETDLCLRLRARGLPIVFSAASVLRTNRRTPTGATRAQFRQGVREFTARWSSAAGSEVVVCRADGIDTDRSWNRSWRLPRPSAPARPAGSDLPAVAWSSHFYEQGGYTEEAISIVEALDDAGIHVVANPVTYDRRWAPVPAHKAQRLAALVARDLPDDFVHVAHIGANRFKRHPAAMYNVGRTMFETDGLPTEWRDACNTMDEIWVPCEHNVRSFTRAGVDPAKLHVVPETFDTELFDPTATPLPVEGLDGFVFLSVFSWLGRKAWDVLVRAWFEEFSGRDDVTLLLKTDTQLAPVGTDCRREIDRFVRDQLGTNPRKGPRIVVLDQTIETADVPSLYRAADAFVLASHGEGWGRPYMEAMAMGLPTIATRWSGNLEFMDDGNSCLIDYELVDAPDDEWMRGQRWAQPSVRDLRRAMRRLYDHQDEARELGARARADVLVSCRPELVADAVRDRLEAIDRHPVFTTTTRSTLDVAAPTTAGGVPPATAVRRSQPKDGRRVTACIVAAEGDTSVTACRASLADVADSITVVTARPDDDMSVLRNEALDRIGGGWVLMLDATQTLDPASVDVVRELVHRGGFVGYTARERHQFGMDGAVSGVDRHVAVLFPGHPDLRWVGAVDAELVPRRHDLDFRLVSAPIVIHEHDGRPERRDAAVRARRHLARLERAVRTDPTEPFHRVALGRALVAIGVPADAETHLRAAIDQAPRHTPWLAAAHVALAHAVAAQGRRAEAVEISKVATRRAPDWAAGWCARGELLLDVGKPERALAAFERALDCSGDTIVTADLADDVSWRIAAAIGRIHLGLGHHEEAAHHLERALADHPDDDWLRVLVAQAYDALGWPNESRRHLETAMARRASPEAYLRFGEHFTETARNALLRGLADHPEHHQLRERLEALGAARAMR